jgi:uncharacterized membrane protein
MLLLGRWLTLTGYFGLLILLLAWNTWLAPPQQLPRTLVLVVLIIPLMFPLRGLLHGKVKTHGWLIFISLFYFTLGIGVAWTIPAERWLGWLEIGFSLLLYIGAVVYIRGWKKLQSDAS